MPHLNGPIDWVPADQAPIDGTIVHGFFDPHTPDTGLHAHIRPVRRYSANGDWFCGVSSHNLGSRGPVMITERIPFPTRAEVRAVLQADIDRDYALAVKRNPARAGYPPLYMPDLKF